MKSAMNMIFVLSFVHNCHAVTAFLFTTKLSLGTMLPTKREITPIKTYEFRVKCKWSAVLFENLFYKYRLKMKVAYQIKYENSNLVRHVNYTLNQILPPLLYSSSI